MKTRAPHQADWLLVAICVSVFLGIVFLGLGVVTSVCRGGDLRHAERTAEVSCLELNHYCDENGRHVFDQVIGWDLYGGVHPWELQGHHARFWGIVSGNNGVVQKRPRRNIQADRWEWFDYTRGIQWRAMAFKESWTQYDPEAIDREAIRPEARTRWR